MVSSPPGGSFKEADRDADVDSKVDDREVIYTTPREPGIYTLKAFVDRMVCGDDDGLDDGCFAEIEITVRRAAAPPSPTAIPVNPAGEIPSVIVDDDGNQYEVFTPEDGGRFEGEGVSVVSVVAEPGAVPNGEIIGVRADTDGEASNIGRTQDRVTLSGSYYGIYAVDASGQALNGYLLDDPINVCLPVPSRFTSNISQLAMVSERPDSTFATLSSSVRLSTSGVLICGALSEVSARLAVGNLGSPSALPSPHASTHPHRPRHRRRHHPHQRIRPPPNPGKRVGSVEFGASQREGIPLVPLRFATGGCFYSMTRYCLYSSMVMPSRRYGSMYSLRSFSSFVVRLFV